LRQGKEWIVNKLCRTLIAIKIADALSVAIPADCQPGDYVFVPNAGSCLVDKESMVSKDEMDCYNWIFCSKKSMKIRSLNDT
jgi:peroxiredoxin 2/4